MTRVSTPLLVLSLVLAVSGAALAQDKIGLKFVGNMNGTAGASLAATDMAGMPDVAQKNWNDLTGLSGTDVKVKTDDGAASPVTVTYKGPVSWRSGVTPATGSNYALMDGYLDTDNDGTAPTVTVKNIPHATYDVYVYFNGDAPNSHREATYTIGTTSVIVNDSDPFTGTFKKSENHLSGNYALFPGVTGASFTLTGTPGHSDDPYKRCSIAAIQIVKHK